jgi:hypothetical protein
MNPKNETNPSADLIAFYWRVPEHGFEWIDAKPDTAAQAEVHRYLVFNTSDSGFQQFSPYDPMVRESALFRIFAEMSPAEESVLIFANEYGLLGSDPTRYGPPTEKVERPLGNGLSVSALGERLESWAAEQHTMREAVDLWDASRGIPERDYGGHQGPEDYLASAIRWSGQTSVGYFGPAPNAKRSVNVLTVRSTFQIVSSGQEELFKRFAPGDLVLPAQYALQRLVNRKMREHASTAKLLWDWTRHRPDLRTQLVPTSLIAAMWLQLANAIDGNRDYRRCEACRKWFEVGSASREDAKFCRRACRFKAYRLRQQRARELAKGGMAPREIAAEIDSDIKTVKGWLKK